MARQLLSLTTERNSQATYRHAIYTVHEVNVRLMWSVMVCKLWSSRAAEILNGQLTPLSGQVTPNALLVCYQYALDCAQTRKPIIHIQNRGVTVISQSAKIISAISLKKKLIFTSLVNKFVAYRTRTIVTSVHSSWHWDSGPTWARRIPFSTWFLISRVFESSYTLNITLYSVEATN